MSILPILIHPDDRLHEIAMQVTDPGAEHINQLVQDMAETMYDAPGVGLAAPQVGVSLRLAVTDTHWKSGRYDQADSDVSVEPERNLKVWINPEFLWKSDETETFEEGCLSVPECYGDVTRPSAIRLRWQDLQGFTHEQDFSGFEAVALQHEFDHLEGKLFIDYLSPLKRAMITKKMKKRFK